MLKKLTIIIPFLNEGIEIENTLKSIRKTAKNNVDIVLINDNSTDKFDYRSTARKYNAAYHLNSERKGVAQSRDIGVSLINTPFFLLIDGHMRFYDNNWWAEFINSLEIDDRAVYCGSCLPLKENGKTIKKHKLNKSFGAFISFDQCYPSEILDPKWVSTDTDINNQTPEIPCILGASYALSVRYWNYIKGLNGLRYYGSDETFLSMKIWLEGGKCILLKNIEIGHIFRNTAPYLITLPDIIYNKLFIAKTLFPEKSKNIELKIKENYPGDYHLVQSLFEKEKDRIQLDADYYKQIFTRDYSYFYNINKNASNLNSFKIKVDQQLRKIANSIVVENKSIGLLTGEMGEIVFLYEYASYINSPFYADFAHNKLSSLTIRLQNDMSNLNLIDGVAGIGIAIQYLIKNDFIEIDFDKLFKNIETSMKELISKNIMDNKFDFFYESAGIIYYFIAKGINILDQELLLKFANCLDKTKEIKQNIILGNLSLLMYAFEYDKNNSDLKKLILEYSNYIQNLNPNKQLSIEPEGDLFIAYTLLRVAKLLSLKVLEIEATNKILSTCNRKDSICEHLYDASLINGSAGASLIYQLSYLYTNRVEFKEAAEYWATDVLIKEIPEFDIYLPYNTENQKYSKSLICGVSGIGLSLLALNSTEMKYWKSWFKL
ncbi:glycosyltransferase [Flavobacterium sp. JAS]|uniref:glycosyltransferase n=1 Tax=Flavobacterium sp. JAS TaxID=2897329 RepID=UPI001E32525F|nr:glycosyltransferase [Flavobacterium sp. JAS]MCD0472676.1 glycosyltransferase [Flavobacterium sp. JAS]